jgi:hypothetical protein
MFGLHSKNGCAVLLFLKVPMNLADIHDCEFDYTRYQSGPYNSSPIGSIFLFLFLRREFPVFYAPFALQVRIIPDRAAERASKPLMEGMFP